MTLFLAQVFFVYKFVASNITQLVCFHYGCALRCVAREIETLSSLYIARHATQSAAVMETALNSIPLKLVQQLAMRVDQNLTQIVQVACAVFFSECQGY